ncbi:MAG: hypothetical protein KatS3mg015_1540 [Fimbriimonadales bacterium]|nr:MAG: hypothetical protein KatS3mg015_1540 [Fimbriimonadales bacterium]
MKARPGPFWMIVVRDDDTTAETDTILWNGLALAVLAIVSRRVRGTTVCKVILAHS